MKCNLSRILGEKRLKISELSRATNINRNTLSRLYNDNASRIETDVIDQLCSYLDITIGELFEAEKIIEKD